MKNCLILGSGRSGTSMIGGIMHNAGYYMGEKMYPPNPSNPKGFFENEEINSINELILSKYDRRHNWYGGNLRVLLKNFDTLCPRLSKILFKSTVYHPSYMQRWLMSIPASIEITNESRNIKRRISQALSRRPFCYKDPRFSYTLPVWAQFTNSATLFLCIFREPNITVKSILKECHTAKYLSNMRINETTAYEVWFNMYSHILEKHLDNNDIMFVHYNQVYEGPVLEKISERLNVKLSHEFVAKSLKRTRSNSIVPEKIKIIYETLCKLSGYVSDGSR